MATPVTDAFIHQIRGAATIMGGVQIDAMSDAAKAVKPVMEAAVVSMAGPDMRLSNNVTRSGAPKGPIKVRYKVGQSDKWGAYARISASGPIALIEHGAPPHEIRPRRSRRQRGKRVAVSTSYGPFAVVDHKGFTGKGRWKKAKDNAAPPAARAAMLARNVTAFRKAFS